MTDRVRRGMVTFAALPAVLVFALFRLADLLCLVPASRGNAALLGPILALLAGGSALAVQLVGARSTITAQLRRLLLAWFVAVLVLFALHSSFVKEKPNAYGDPVGAVVISWSRAGCEGETVNCTGQSTEECLKGLAWDQGRIEDCWGEGRVATVQIGLILSSLLASGGFGGLVGLLALARRARRGAEPAPFRLFLCYRRADSGPVADRLHRALAARFGDGNVFRDVEAIRLGEDFRRAVQRAISGCDVFLVLLGPGWLGATDESGARRLDRPDDPVRIEIETAIARGLRIVPVLVGGAEMPRRDQMPAGLQELSDRAGARITGDPAAEGDPALAASVEALIRGLEEEGEGEA